MLDAKAKDRADQVDDEESPNGSVDAEVFEILRAAHRQQSPKPEARTFGTARY